MAYELDARGTQGREAEGGITPSPRRVRGSPKAHRAARGTNFNETDRRMKMDNEKKESAIVGCATIAIVFGFLATVATNLWLTWRICRAVEAILAK